MSRVHLDDDAKQRRGGEDALGLCGKRQGALGIAHCGADCRFHGEKHAEGNVIASFARLRHSGGCAFESFPEACVVEVEDAQVAHHQDCGAAESGGAGEFPAAIQVLAGSIVVTRLEEVGAEPCLRANFTSKKAPCLGELQPSPEQGQRLFATL